MLFISSSDKPDACIMVFIGTLRDRRLAAIFTLAAFPPLAMPSAIPSVIHSTLPFVMPSAINKKLSLLQNIPIF